MSGLGLRQCVCLWLGLWLGAVSVAVIGAGPPNSPPLSELRSQLSGVEELLEEFRKQLREDEPVSPVPVPVPGHTLGPADSCVHSYGLRQDYIIRTKDSLSAGAGFLSAPAAISSWSQCLHSCCSNRHCTLAVVELERGQGQDQGQGEGQGQPTLNCYLFNCTYKSRNVCRFSPHQGYSSFSRAPNGTHSHQEPQADRSNSHTNSRNDDPPQSNAGQDVMLLVPTNWAILDGRGSVDDYGIVRYEWTLLQGDPSVDLKSPQPGMLKLTNLREGVYVVQLSVTDAVGQKSSDNVTVTVMPQKHQTTDCTGVCRRYQFICEDGCCIDITLACDGTAQCPDESDEAFCRSFNADGKPVTHTSISGGATQSRTTGLEQNDATRSSVENLHQALMEESRPLQAYDSGETQTPVAEGGGKPETGSLGGEDSPETSSVETSEHETISKLNQPGGGHPVPESGAVLPLALGLAITALLLLMVGCRLRLVRQKLKKARPISSEESDYLINGMYL